MLSKHVSQFAEEGTHEKWICRRVSSLSFPLPLLTVESARWQPLGWVFGPGGLARAARPDPIFGPA